MIAGLYAVVNGYNMAYKRIFDFYCSMDGQVACSSHMFINPAAFPVPDLSTDRLKEIHDFGKKLDLMELTKRNRTKLALYWFEQGLRSNGLDGFIKHWIAIEMLAIPDGTSVEPVNEILAWLYGCTKKEASDRFMVGRIQGLRSRILHKGEDLPIHQDLSRYVEALFFDLLMASFGVNDVRMAASVMGSPNFNLRKLTHT